MVHTDFGAAADGSPYTIELGANWVHGRRNNPMWDFVQQYDMVNITTNDSRVAEYDQNGPARYMESTLAEWAEAQEKTEDLLSYMEENDIPDMPGRAALRYAGWYPDNNPYQRAIEWYEYTWDYGAYPEEVRLENSGTDDDVESTSSCGHSGNNDTDWDVNHEYNDEFIMDPRGYNFMINEQAREFLNPDEQLLLHTTVANVTYDDDGVEVYADDGTCIRADYAICTFSIGVLQSNSVSFSPVLPTAKRFAISSMQMTIYMKLFLQFPENFWGEDEHLLYADPTGKGYYPVWQSLSAERYIPGSNIILATVVGDEARRIERQSDEATQAEMMEVLRTMFPGKTIPEPTAFLYPRWGQTTWTHGSYSITPAGFSEDMFVALRENVGNLWFAGEALAESQSTTHGAWQSGREVGAKVAELILD